MGLEFETLVFQVNPVTVRRWCRFESAADERQATVGVVRTLATTCICRTILLV